MNVYNRTEIVDLTEYTPNGEWELLEVGILIVVVADVVEIPELATY